jgi:ABC-2 type transport system ATP-binding protein
MLNKEKALEVRELKKDFGEMRAVDGVSFDVFKGDVFGFLGPNGAGKSTTIRMILSLIAPSSGNIKIFGKDLSTDRDTILRKVGAIVEKPDLYGYLSAYENIRLLSKLSGYKASRTRILSVLDLVGLRNRAYDKIKTFSQGMKQRVGVAQALIHEPELIILDEPTNGLDPQGMVEMRKLIQQLNRERGMTILLSSHLLHEVELLADRMVIINKGKVVVEGSVSELLNSDKMKVTVVVDDGPLAKEVLGRSGYSDTIVSLENNELIMELGQESIADVNHILNVNNIRVSKLIPVRTLEDYFLSLT